MLIFFFFRSLSSHSSYTVHDQMTEYCAHERKKKHTVQNMYVQRQNYEILEQLRTWLKWKSDYHRWDRARKERNQFCRLTQATFSHFNALLPEWIIFRETVVHIWCAVFSLFWYAIAIEFGWWKCWIARFYLYCRKLQYIFFCVYKSNRSGEISLSPWRRRKKNAFNNDAPEIEMG